MGKRAVNIKEVFCKKLSRKYFSRSFADFIIVFYETSHTIVNIVLFFFFSLHLYEKERVAKVS
jgi:hypothetical protein